jgi:hypothetical protein
MRNKLLLSLFILCSVLASAQNWSGILAPSRAMDWSDGHVGVSGGIPSGSWTQCGATMVAGSTAAQINSRIQSCPANQYVLLAAGTFNLNAGISFAGKSNVALRGAGANQTFLVFSNTSGCIIYNAAVCLSGTSNASTDGPQNIHNWTGTTEGGAGVYPKGATHLTVDSASGYQVGTLLVLDQIEDQSDPGKFFVSDSRTYSQEGGAPGRNCGSTTTCRVQHQFVQVTNISGTTLTVSPSLHLDNWVSGRSPQTWTQGVLGSDVNTLDGIENLSVDSTGDSSSSSNIEIGTCYQCWVKGVRSVRTLTRNHIWIWEGARAEIRDNYIYGSQGTSQAYGIEPFYSGDNLIINNIIQRTTGGITDGNEIGSVIAYNLLIYNYYPTVATWQISDISFHDGGNALTLLEGNVSNAFGVDDIHGTQGLLTGFRNRFQGWETGKNQQTLATFLMAYNRDINLIGNVLGTDTYHNTYEAAEPSNTNFDTSIYSEGWTGAGGNCCSMAEDSLVKTTLMRWGNYDTVSAAVRWVSGEVPSGLSAYANAVPSSQTLPASFFLSSKPSWFGSSPWPPIGPDVTSGNIGRCSGGTYANSDATAGKCTGGTLVTSLGGHANAIPAQTCYFNTMNGPADGSGSVLAFNANTCYAGTGSAGAPNPPSGLSVTVQ